MKINIHLIMIKNKPQYVQRVQKRRCSLLLLFPSQYGCQSSYEQKHEYFIFDAKGVFLYYKIGSFTKEYHNNNRLMNYIY